MSTLVQEQDNFLRYAILTVEHSTEALQNLIELNLRNKHLTFEKFLDQNQHEIYHFCYGSKCCLCQPSSSTGKQFMNPSQLETLFDKHNKKLSCRRANSCTDFCCSKSKVNITTQVLDLSLARCLLVNCCLDVFWFTCLATQGQTLEQFLNYNKHIIYHLCKNDQKCCQCPTGFIFPRNYPVITENEWQGMFNSVLLPCINDRKRKSTGTTSVCSVAAMPGKDIKDIRSVTQGLVLKWCCSVRKSVEKLVEYRNLKVAHVTNARLSDVNFTDFFKETEECILDITTVCGNKKMKDAIKDLRVRPIDSKLCAHYQNILLQNINRNEHINENIHFQHRTTRQLLSRKVRKMNKQIGALKKSIVMLEKNVQLIPQQIIDHSKRSQFIRETSAEIENHIKDQTYTEIKAVKACVQMLDNSKVLILSGREGSGKSRNSLEILRQMKDKHPEIDVIKLKRLSQLSGIIEKDAMTIMLFEDVFGRITKQFCENTDVQILDSLHSYINLGNVKVIFVMRNTVKQECKSILSSHEIFCKTIAYLDLSSKEFGLSLKEKEQIFINYCTKNRIEIIYKKEPSYHDAMWIKIDKIKVPIVDETDVSCRSADNTCIVVNSWSVESMIRSDPYQGFPQYCRLFTQNKKLTMLGAHFFKYPLESLLQEIESMRMERLDNHVKGLKYVILVYILLNQTTTARSIRVLSEFATEIDAINENSIDVQAHQQLFNECYNEQIGLKLQDIMNLYKELTCKYLTRRDNEIYFQHRAIQDSVLISYSKTNPKAIIPLLSIDHMIDIVRTQNYMEEEEEIVIKISKIYYPELAVKMISSINISQPCSRILDRLMESKIISENDEDLIYEVISFINNEFHTSFHCFFLNIESYIYHYFPLHLLRNIGKLDDKTLTVNHTKNQMLISVTIKDKNVTLRVDPSISLNHAFQSKYIDIFKWLLKNTDHSLLYFTNCVTDDLNPDRILEYTKLLLQNVKHDMLDMTQLFIDVCCSSSNKEKHAIDWMLDNVDNSLIDYVKCFDEMLELGDLEMLIDSILYIVKKTSHVSFDINNLVYKSCQYEAADVLIKVLQSVDPELFKKEELIDTMFHNFVDYNDDEDFWNKIVELISPWIKYCDINKLIEKADNCRWYRVLEFLITLVSDLSIDIVKLIKNIFTCWDEEEDEYEGNDNEHIEKVFRLLLKHHTDSIGVAELIMEKSCQIGSHCVVEELLLDKFDNISYYLNKTLDKCLSRRFDEISANNYGGYGKLLMVFIHRVNTKFIDLDSLMSDFCNIGHSSAVLWLLDNNHSHCFDMKYVMNKACYHGDLELVEYLFQKYSAEDFDYKTAMIKACRNSKEETLDVCKWLWGNIDRNFFNMKVALNNASRYDNTAVVKWILKDVDTELFDIENAIFCACEHGNDHTVMLLLNESGINTFNLQYAITVACKNEYNGYTIITKLLYERADKPTVDMNAVFSAACKNYMTDIVQWIIKTCDQNITVTETITGNKHFIKSPDKNRVDMDQAVSCILDMNVPEQEKGYVNETKIRLLMLILNKSDPSIIHIYKLLTEACTNDWVDIFQWILEKVDHSCLNISEIINVACRYGAFKIVKWSLKKIDIKLVDVDNVMVESCGFGWLECLVLVWKNCCQYKLQAAMTEACTYGRLHIAEWLLQNVHLQLFNIPILLKEAGRNGWINIFTCLLQNFHFDKSDMQTATSRALGNGHLEIAELGITKVGKEGFDFSSLSENAYVGINKEGVVNFLLHNIDHRSIDIATFMTNACFFGWKDVATYIIDNDLTSLCDLSLAFNTACDNGELEIAQLLLDKVDPHIITTFDKAMHSVAVKGWDEIALLLLDKVEHTRLDIRNALIEACRYGEIDVVQAIFRKLDNTMLDVEAALYKACENHMHEELVLWILENINQKQVDLKTVKIQAIRHRWMKVQFAMKEVDTENLNQGEQETETDFIVIS